MDKLNNTEDITMNHSFTETLQDRKRLSQDTCLEEVYGMNAALMLEGN